MISFHTRQRLRWAALRKGLEKKAEKKGIFEGHGIRVDTLSKLAAACLRATPVYSRGFRNAAFPRLVRQTLWFPGLPPEFDGFTLLHLTDLHLDSIPELAPRTAALIRRADRETPIHACMLTGDFIDRHAHHGFDDIMAPMREICGALPPREGIFAVLGNHDTWKMVSPFEEMGIQMLNNETRFLRRGQATLALTGLDDPNRFRTPEALQALENAEPGFRIALIHTPELYREAARSGVDLYLTGHTHGGQISLPGGRPILLPLREGRQFYRGVWRYKGMTGFTGQGLGTVSIPIRFNTFSEAALIRLRSGENPPGV